ncbi:lycopene beta-cyclase CrtY [Novosphingobium rosa]|uniref:lycopene beta-cyclase CrtY n=1 Tax=Novosphingobium rosa TaxID=76978 RepID=UPI000A046E93|nr:lycopene beta-cyclase CrtY [Novosphingobium rosa]
MGAQRDLVILGGGLAGGLAALAVTALRPEWRVTLVEAGERCGGNHVWSFFDSDVAAADRWLVDPLVVKHWGGHATRFPGAARHLPMGYNSLTGERLDAVLEERLPEGAILRGCAAVEVSATHVTLADGRRLEAGAVLDARGAAGFPGLKGGWQKFVGQMWRTGPHGFEKPVIMDATVEQRDGYRFIYVLPFAPDKLFVEDTYYSAHSGLDRDLLAERIKDYVAGLGLSGAELVHEEQGVLPVVAGGKIETYLAATRIPGVGRIGVRAALFHPLTSYSLPTAVETALAIARAPTLSALDALCESRARSHWRESAFFRLLAKMMFGAGQPERWHRVFERFYRLNEGLIARFYAGRLTAWDKLWLVTGRPPVPLGAAIATLMGGGNPPAGLDHPGNVGHDSPQPSIGSTTMSPSAGPRASGVLPS